MRIKSISSIRKGFNMTKDSDIDFIDAMKPLYYISKIFGMAPYKTTIVENRKKYVTSCCQTVLSVTILLVIIVIFKLGLDQRSNVVYDLSAIGSFVELLQELMLIIMSVGQFLMAWIHREKYIKMLDKIRDQDGAMVSLGIWINYTKMRWSIICVVFGWISLSSVETILDWIFVYQGESIIYWTTNWIPYFISSITECTVMSSLMCLRHRYLILNKSLKDTVKEPDVYMNQGVKIISSKKLKRNWMENMTKNLSKYSHIHWHLTDCGRQIDQLFSFSILLLVTNSFIAIVSSLFYMWVNFKIVGGFTFADIYEIAYYSIITIFRIIIIISNYSSTTYQANKTVHILHRMQDCSLDMELVNTIELMSLQLYHNKLSFTACGLFTLDYTLLHSVIAGVTTCLIILINFSGT